MTLRRSSIAVLIVSVIGLAQSAGANTAALVPIETLAVQADVIVAGRVTAVAGGVDPAVDGVYTYVTIDASEVLRGAPEARYVVKLFGGVAGNRGIYVPGQARFAVGEDVLLFLGARARDGSLFTLGLWQGKWRLTNAGGATSAVKIEPDSQTIVETHTLAAVRTQLMRLPQADRPVERAITVTPRETPRESAPFVLNDPPIRWAKSPVLVNVESGAQPGLATGGLPEILRAIQQWNSVGSNLTLVPGSRVPPRCQSVVGTDILITFADPCGEISNDPNVLAVAAFGFDPSVPMVVNGRTFFAITDAVITTSRNPEVQLFLTLPSCFQSTIAHELGHAVGLDHTPDPAALMYFTETGACFSGPIPLSPDDVAGFLTIYPRGATLPPTGGGTPAQPTITLASANSGILNLAWTSAGGASPTAHRLDFFSGGTLVASVTVGGGSTAAIPIPPGTVGSFAVQVTPIAGTNAGPASPLFPFTIGGGTSPGGCTTAPAAPAPSGSVIGGTATVSWASVASATAYIVSAGSTQGAANLFAPTNVGASTTVSAGGLPAGFSAWVRVVAVNACGQSAPGDFFLSSGSVPPTGTPAGTASIQFVTAANACACWASPITLQIDGQTVGSMSCSASGGPFSLPAGFHNYRACDNAGCVGNSVTLAAGQSVSVTLSCQ